MFRLISRIRKYFSKEAKLQRAYKRVAQSRTLESVTPLQIEQYLDFRAEHTSLLNLLADMDDSCMQTMYAVARTVDHWKHDSAARDHLVYVGIPIAEQYAKTVSYSELAALIDQQSVLKASFEHIDKEYDEGRKPDVEDMITMLKSKNVTGMRLSMAVAAIHHYIEDIEASMCTPVIPQEALKEVDKPLPEKTKKYGPVEEAKAKAEELTAKKKQKGRKKGGRKYHLTDEIREAIRKDVIDGTSNKNVKAKYGISYTTLSRIKRKLREENLIS